MGCAETPRTVATLTIEGDRIDVAEYQDPQSYYAVTRTLLANKPSAAARRVQAIERVTGCPVDLASITHWLGAIYAELDCEL